MAVDDQILPPLTNEDLDRLAALNQPTAGTLAPIPAGDAPNHDETSDRDAEGEVDHDFLDYVDVAKPPSTLVPEAKAEAHGSISLDQAANEFESLKVMLEEPEPVLPPAPKEPLINPIDAPLGNGNARSSSSFAAWKKYTIFDKPFAGPSEQSPISPLAEQPETASLALLILINASVRIPVILKDIHPSTNSTRKRLDEVTAEVQSMSQGAPGKFYKGQAVADVIKALICGGSNARVVLQEGVDANVKESFDRFNSRLKDGSLFVAVFGSQVLAFCSSESSELVAKLGASPNLVGLGENVLVSEVLIGDDSAYIDAIMNAKDEPW
ncbi:uncharacterized protein PHACADRAFT_143274 [Phanerochaete carnosa HHB-10118-sp]|uniref:Uncharacterized protein n=1 Tax=Phanerochaete carnosa (strain HHB-10118-sp) TaxID=650164 RepID=K5VUK4_PHACS|nr:uncharacterized protein PHACADRAFT_143274 [Phanerochaete carnosa HHB-10118-sp]EKM55218.1 hypothetical protein PHACADRAFT_143274 [Phanerochaete carnosa HHB-10118-sp]